MKKKVALFSGSFNPIHIGHLALANYIVESSWVDELWFMVTPQNPLKTSNELLNDNTRLKLVEIAIEGYSKFKASNFEFNLPQPSYTINTLDALKQAYPEYEFYLLIGADNWLLFNQWKDYQLILQNYNLLVYPRLGYQVDAGNLPPHVHLIDSPMMEVSSTFIRESLLAGKDYRFFLRPSVYLYIKKNGLYINSSTHKDE